MTLRHSLLALGALFAAGLASPAAAQPAVADTLTAADGWQRTLAVQLAGSQAAYRNWQEGGVSAVAATGSVDGFFARANGAIRQAHEFRAALGVLQQDTLALRKADDVARYGFGLEYDLGGPVRPSLALTARTQFAAGFDYNVEAGEYDDVPVAPNADGFVKVSDAAAPLYLTQSLGVVYDPGGGFSARTGLGLKETVVAIERLRPLYGNALDQQVRTEVGLDAELRVVRPLMENVLLSSRLSAFQAFNQVGDTAPDVLWENRVVLTVNPILNVTLDTGTLYDRDLSDELQLRQSLAVGVGFSLL